MWLTVGLAAAYALVIALAFPPSANTSSTTVTLLFWEGLFTGPAVVASILSVLLARVRARNILLGFAAGYSVLTAITFYWTFGFEHDAQYQLMLFLVPMIGFPSVVIAGLAAAMTR